MTTVTDDTQAPSPDDMLEAAVMMQEEVLAARDEESRGAEPRYQVYLDINGKKVPIIDQPEEEKFKIATEAVNKRAESYEEETYRLAQFKLEQMNVVEAVDLIRELSPGDREIYLRAEKSGKNRDSVFKVFGQPTDTKE